MQPEELGVLIVDEVSAVRSQLKEILESLGFRKIAYASNGEEAKMLLLVDKTHLILSEWHMSPVNGFELLKFVRREPEHRDTVFMMITAERTRERVMQAVACGVDEYLLKPVATGQLQFKLFRSLFKRGFLR